MSQIDTKTRLLDAAESLFSMHGFSNTSMRAITTQASANLAAANYHFGTKEALLSAVLDRRLLPLNQQRSERIDQVLAAADAASSQPASADLLRAFIEPTMAFRCDESGSSDFVNIIGRSLTSADPVVRDLFIERVRPLLNKLHQSLCLALPQIPAELIFIRLFFAMGAMGHCICFSGIASIFKSHKSCNPEDKESLTDNLLAFVTAGLEAPC